MFTVFYYRIFSLNIRYEIVEQVFFESGESLHPVRGHDIYRAIILYCPSVWHNHYHRLNLLIGIQIIKDNLRLSSIEPFPFIAADAM